MYLQHDTHDSEHLEARRIVIAQQLTSISKQFFHQRKNEEGFQVRIEPYIRGTDEASCACVERSQRIDNVDPTSDCEDEKLRHDEIKVLLDMIRNISPQLKESGFPLKKLSLESCSIPLMGESIEEFSRFLESIPTIDSFTLRFMWCGIKMPPKYIFYIQRVSSQLKELYLHFGLQPQHAEQCISNLAKVVDSCRNLELLYLDGIECEGITNVCLQKMAKMTQKLQNLNTFVLKLRQSQYIDQQGIINFGNELSISSSLLRLEMSFYYFMNTFPNESMVALSKAISKSVGLESLSIEFFWCSDITDSAAEIIVSSIRNIPNLTQLLINFSGSSMLTNQTLESIGQVLHRNEQIEKLTLEFGNCEAFTDEGLLELSSNIAGCSKIEELTTDFSSCFGITDTGIEHICMVLPQLSQLKDLLIQTHEFISSQTQELVNELMKSVKEYNQQMNGLNLSLHVMNGFSKFLKRKDVINDIIE